jgi:hypothetical protein
MAFLEAYKAMVQAARDAGKVPRWSPSLGTDPASREGVLLEAQAKGRLPASFVAGLLPYRGGPADIVAQLITGPAP